MGIPMRRLLAALAVVCFLVSPHAADATVTTSTRAVTYTGSGTSTFTVTFPFLAKADITVTKTLIATGAAVTPFTRGVHYNVFLPVGSANGYVTTTAAVTSSYTLTITRTVPYTQTTSFKTQGTYSAAAHEAAFDKLTMEVQQLIGSVAVDADITTAINDHEAEADPHTGYAKLTGRASGQHLQGGTAAGENLQLSSTADVTTKGKVLIGSGGNELTVDDVNNRVGIGTATPSQKLHVVGSILQDGSCDVVIEGGDGGLYTRDDACSLGLFAYDTAVMNIGAELALYPSTHATKPSYLEATGDQFELFDVAANTLLKITPSGVSFDDVGVLTLRIAGTGGTIYGGDTASDNLTLSSTSNGTKGFIYLGATVAYNETSGNFGIGDTTPSYKLEVEGTAEFNGIVVGAQRNVAAGGAAYTAAAPIDCGGYIWTATNNANITLPASSAANQGCVITVANLDTLNTNLVNVIPTGNDTISGTCVGTTGAGAATVAVFGTNGVGAATKGVRNPAASNVPGDYVEVMSVGASALGVVPAGWVVIGCRGLWESIP